MFISGALLLPAIGLSAAVEEPAPLLIPFTIFFMGMIWMLYCRLFADDTPTVKQQLPTHLHRPNEYLPPAQVNPAPGLRAREPNTAEIAQPPQPPSVTEYTTNLLRNRK